jgi:beta-lactamase superfamily II metal-dependent hydrolase
MQKRIGVLILGLMLSVLLLYSLAHGDVVNSLQVSFIDVGQGDSIWLHASDHTDILIDGSGTVV